MRFTPGAVRLLYGAIARADDARRSDFMQDVRTAMYAKDPDFTTLIRKLRRARNG